MRLKGDPTFAARLLLFAGLAAILLPGAGCGKLDPDEVRAKLRQEPKSLFSFPEIQNPELKALLGEWQTECLRGSESHSFRYQLAISYSRVTLTLREYDDPECADLSLSLEKLSEITRNTRYDLRENRSGFDLNLRLRTMLLTLSGDDAPAAHQSRLCGESDWKNGESKEVAGKSCSGYATPPQGTESRQYLEQGPDGKLSYLSRIFQKRDPAEIPR